VLYTIFNWVQAFPKARINVIAISNTLDLPERGLNHRVSSRLGTNRLTFQPYDHKEIEEIIKYRISECSAIKDEAIQLAARKVASVSGDLRKSLDFLRRAIEIALEEAERDSTAAKDVQLTFHHVNEAVQESMYSIRVQYCLSMSKHEDLLFRAIVNDMEATGTEEATFYDVLHEYYKLCNAQCVEALSSSLAFHVLMQMASAHIAILSSDAGELSRKVQLGFALHEAQFCIRQMDLRLNNPPKTGVTPLKEKMMNLRFD